MENMCKSRRENEIKWSWEPTCVCVCMCAFPNVKQVFKTDLHHSVSKENKKKKRMFENISVVIGSESVL